MHFDGLRPVGSRRRDSVRAALVVVTVIAGLIVAVFLFIDSDRWNANVFLLGPPLLGAFAAVVSGGRVELLAIAAAAFVAVGVAIGIAVGAVGGLGEGGAIVIPWIVANELVGLYGAVGVWRLARHIRARSS